VDRRRRSRGSANANFFHLAHFVFVAPIVNLNTITFIITRVYDGDNFHDDRVDKDDAQAEGCGGGGGIQRQRATLIIVIALSISSRHFATIFVSPPLRTQHSDGQTFVQLNGDFVDGQAIVQLTGEFVDGQTFV
jgi:hypothetical protein